MFKVLFGAVWHILWLLNMSELWHTTPVDCIEWCSVAVLKSTSIDAVWADISCDFWICLRSCCMRTNISPWKYWLVQRGHFLLCQACILWPACRARHACPAGGQPFFAPSFLLTWLMLRVGYISEWYHIKAGEHMGTSIIVQHFNISLPASIRLQVQGKVGSCISSYLRVAILSVYEHCLHSNNS